MWGLLGADFCLLQHVRHTIMIKNLFRPCEAFMRACLMSNYIPGRVAASRHVHASVACDGKPEPMSWLCGDPPHHQ